MNTITKIILSSLLFGLTVTAHSNSFNDELFNIHDVQTLRLIKEHLRVLTLSPIHFCTKEACSWCNGCSDNELIQRKNDVAHRIRDVLGMQETQSPRRS